MNTQRPDSRPFGLAEELEQIREKPALTSIAVVSRLLREAFGKALTRRGDYFASRAPNAAALDVADMDALARLLQGQDSSEYVVQPWNSEGQMGEYVKAACCMECERSDAVFILLLTALGTLYEKIDEAGRRGTNPSRDIDALIGQTTAALLGVPRKPRTS
jgi:hypothetical protein